MEFDKTLKTDRWKCFFQRSKLAVCVSRSNCGNSPRSKFGSPPPCPAAQGQATQTVRTGAQQTAPSPPVLSPHHPWPLCCSPGAGAAWVWPHSPIRPVARGRAWGGQGADQAGRSGACAWRIAFPWPRGIGAAAERAWGASGPISGRRPRGPRRARRGGWATEKGSRAAAPVLFAIDGDGFGAPPRQFSGPAARGKSPSFCFRMFKPCFWFG